MASLVLCQAVAAAAAVSSFSPRSISKPSSKCSLFAPLRLSKSASSSRGPQVVCAVGDVSPDSTNFLIAGAVAIALVGTAFPILFSRKDLCPVCDGAGFVRKTGTALSANAARKDVPQIVCRNCNGLGKVGQVDKADGPLTPRKRR